MPMIPTYIKNDGLIPKGVPAAVIDAGGTNFRSRLVTFTDEGYELSDVTKHKMPGTDKERDVGGVHILRGGQHNAAHG